MPTPRIPSHRSRGAVIARLSREVVSARSLAGLTQREVARRAGISQSMVAHVESGRAIPSLDVLRRLAGATGHDLSIRLFPGGGVRLRDSGQLAVAERIRSEANPRWRVRLEVPVAPPPDRRAADMVLELADELVLLEIERALLDLQAQLRAAQLKRTALAETSGRRARLVMAIPDSPRNRSVVAAHEALLLTALPIRSRRLWACLRSGEPLGGDGLLWVRSGGREHAGAGD